MRIPSRHPATDKRKRCLSPLLDYHLTHVRHLAGQACPSAIRSGLRCQRPWSCGTVSGGKMLPPQPAHSPSDSSCVVGLKQRLQMPPPAPRTNANELTMTTRGLPSEMMPSGSSSSPPELRDLELQGVFMCRCSYRGENWHRCGDPHWCRFQLCCVRCSRNNYARLRERLALLTAATTACGECRFHERSVRSRSCKSSWCRGSR